MNTKLNKSNAEYGKNKIFGFRQISIMLIFAFVFALAPALVNAQIVMVNVRTGADDLRSGNSASLALFLRDGTFRSRTISTGFAGYSSVDIPVDFTERGDVLLPTEVIRVELSHNGQPRSGQPFDTYDNWDMRSFNVRLGSILIYDSERDTRFSGVGIRFTGTQRFIRIPLNVAALPTREADFVITRLIGSPSGVQVTVQNIGNRSGLVTNIRCFTSTRSISRTITADIGSIAVTASRSYMVSFVPAGRVTCAVTGTSDSGLAESVTANNMFTRLF